jgi:hypothetical protein
MKITIEYDPSVEEELMDMLSKLATKTGRLAWKKTNQKT